MSRHGGSSLLGFIFGALFGTITWTCDQLIPVAVLNEPKAQAMECRMYKVPVYDDPLDGGLGECTLVDVWSDVP